VQVLVRRRLFAGLPSCSSGRAGGNDHGGERGNSLRGPSRLGLNVGDRLRSTWCPSSAPVVFGRADLGCLPLPDLGQHLHHPLHLGRREQPLRPLRADVEKR